MPCAINFGTYLLVSPNGDGVFRFSSLNFDDCIDIELQNSYTREGEGWYVYPLGFIDHWNEDHLLLKQTGDCVYSNIPG